MNEDLSFLEFQDRAVHEDLSFLAFQDRAVHEDLTFLFIWCARAGLCMKTFFVGSPGKDCA